MVKLESISPKHRNTFACQLLQVCVLITIGLMVGVNRGVAQLKDFEVPDFQDDRLASLLKGSEARDLGEEKWQLTDMRLEFYRYPEGKQELEFAVEAPQCTFDAHKQVAYSEGQLKVQSQDGNIKVEGTGFLWDQEKGYLTISNRVSTLLKPQASSEQVAPKQPPEEESSGPPVAITAESFHYDLNTGGIVYRKDVTALKSGQFKLSCRVLRAPRSHPSAPVQTIIAEENVIIQSQDPTQIWEIRGEKAVYETEKGRDQLSVSKNPRWQAQGHSGQAERLDLFPTKHVFIARDGGSMQLIAMSRMATETQTRRPAESENPIVISFLECRFSPGQVVFKGNVDAHQLNRLKLVCKELTGYLSESFQVTRLIAEQQAQIQLQENQTLSKAVGDRIVYFFNDQGEEELDITGDPTWTTTQPDGQSFSGSGDRLLVHVNREQFSSLGNAIVRLTPTAEDTEAVDSGTVNQEITIKAGEAHLESVNARFAGDVSVQHRDWRLSADRIALTLADQPPRIRSGLATGAVILDHFGNRPSRHSDAAANQVPSGFWGMSTDEDTSWILHCEWLRLTNPGAGYSNESVEAKNNVRMIQTGSESSCGHLIYQVNHQKLRMEENPVVTRADGIRTVGEWDTVFILDRRAGRFREIGRSKTYISAQALRQFSPDTATNP